MITRKVFIPTDFSSTCTNGSHYALDFCKYYQCDIEVFHVDNGTLTERVNQQLETIRTLQIYQKKFGFNCDFSISEGELIDQIYKRVEETKPGFFFLATHGKVGYQRIMGSLAYQLIQKLNVPVWVVQSKRFIKINRFALPINWQMCEGISIEYIIKVAKFLQSSILIIPRFENKGKEFDIIFDFVYRLKKELTKQNIEFIDIVSKENGGNFAGQVLDFCQKYSADMIAVTSKIYDYPSLEMWNEQFVFNLKQIPVLCLPK